MSVAEMRTAPTNGIETAFIDCGSGPPLLLLHGFARDHTVWDAQIETLPRSYRLIVPDTRGMGETKHPDPGSAITIEQLADDSAALLEALDIPFAAVAGFSMGGYALFHLIMNHPNKVRAAAFVSTRASADDPSKASERIRQMNHVRDEGAEAFAATLVPHIFAAHFIDSHPEVVEATRRVIAAQVPNNIALRADAMRQRVDMTPRLSEITCPCAVIGGSEDRIVPPHAMKELHEGLPNSTFDMLEGVGHMSPLEAPEGVSFCLDQLMQHAGMWM